MGLSLSLYFAINDLHRQIKYNPKGLLTLGLQKYYLVNIHHRSGTMHLRTRMFT